MRITRISTIKDAFHNILFQLPHEDAVKEIAIRWVHLLIQYQYATLYSWFLPLSESASARASEILGWTNESERPLIMAHGYSNTSTSRRHIEEKSIALRYSAENGLAFMRYVYNSPPNEPLRFFLPSVYNLGGHVGGLHGGEYWCLKEYVYKFEYSNSDTRRTDDEERLLLLEFYDKDRKKFERLKHLYDSGTTQAPSNRRERIPENVRIEVWRRDDGKCAHCGSRENLEYDHIVPVSRGGGNTARNIELLCQACNRKKSDHIE